MRKFLLPIFLFGFVALMNAQTAAPQATNATTPGTLTVTTTTASAGGNRSPLNYVAIWVQSGTGTFVKTLYQYGQNYISDLTSWVSNSAKNKAGLVLNATTGATLPSHGTRTCKWDGMNASSVIQVDGSYTVKLEIIDQEGGATVGSTGHKLATYTFTKGATSSTGTLSGTASSSFNNVTLAWVPTSPAGVNEVQLSNLYSVYPNPTKSTVFVSGVDIKQIELCDLSGRRIFTSNEQKINLANLPKGTYLANVITEKGTFIKKIIKE